MNKALSQQRAEAVTAALVAKGIARIAWRPKVTDRQHPVASNDTEEGRAQNRRMALRVLIWVVRRLRRWLINGHDQELRRDDRG
jgi:outer membrane protein OmpA-like peptidoglycan-associated protein